MARSPADASTGAQSDYDMGWAATHRMMREGMSWSGREKNCSFLNLGNGHFADVSALSGLGFVDDGRAAAVLDWDLDGSLDLWLANRTAPQLRLMRNRGAGDHRWVAFRLQGTACERDAIGARVEVHLAGEDGRRRVRGLRAGEGYLAQSSRWVHFGLGARDGGAPIEAVTVRWPGGVSERFTGVEADRRWVLVQGAGAASEWTAPAREIRLVPAEQRVEPPTERARIELFARLPLPTFAYDDESGSRRSTQDLRGRPALINLWGSFCAPCVAELRELEAHGDELQAAGLALLALGVEQGPERVDADLMLDRIGWTRLRGHAETTTLDTLDLFQKSLVDRKRRMPVPTSFLVDRQGLVAVVYKGPVEVETLLADLERLEADPDSVREAAAPRPGRWHAPLVFPAPNLLEIVRDLRQAGLLEAAASYHRYLGLSPESAQDPQMRTLFQFVLQEGRQLGLELSEAELFDEALEVYGRVLEMNPGGLRARANVVTILTRLGRLPETLPHYRTLAEAQPNNLNVRLALASVLQQTGRPEDAAAELRAILERKPDHFRAHLELGRVYRALQRPQDARREFERALALRPGNAEARRELDAAGGTRR